MSAVTVEIDVSKFQGETDAGERAYVVGLLQSAIAQIGSGHGKHGQLVDLNGFTVGTWTFDSRSLTAVQHDELAARGHQVA